MQQSTDSDSATDLARHIFASGTTDCFALPPDALLSAAFGLLLGLAANCAQNQSLITRILCELFYSPSVHLNITEWDFSPASGQASNSSPKSSHCSQRFNYQSRMSAAAGSASAVSPEGSTTLGTSYSCLSVRRWRDRFPGPGPELSSPMIPVFSLGLAQIATPLSPCRVGSPSSGVSSTLGFEATVSNSYGSNSSSGSSSSGNVTGQAESSEPLAVCPGGIAQSQATCSSDLKVYPYPNHHHRYYTPLSDRQDSFVGLKNAGATCYMNAILQQLFQLAPIRDSVLLSSPERLLQRHQQLDSRTLNPNQNETTKDGRGELNEPAKHEEENRKVSPIC
ncbi:unnamed protein product [Protopolystoma xenopodis]|uniref:USP domain-containing protein n=1 Tax=Protopolystoma xenopodis TaxID=117903 RepID=A0A448WC44_9PLAT|nr:unnamed protein product [Protopolystoma xenopodis]